ncbi:MAG: hypothetical protein J2P17_20750, partial [Mycobacterium sp.]|nr:hypothetical protein [Mycobacterium sp.]
MPAADLSAAGRDQGRTSPRSSRRAVWAVGEIAGEIAGECRLRYKARWPPGDLPDPDFTAGTPKDLRLQPLRRVVGSAEFAAQCA